jgi:hypothetical protein
MIENYVCLWCAMIGTNLCSTGVSKCYKNYEKGFFSNLLFVVEHDFSFINQFSVPLKLMGLYYYVYIITEIINFMIDFEKLLQQ